MKKTFALLAALCLLLTMVSIPAFADELTTVNVAYMPNYASLWSVVAADRSGAFAEQGIKINLVEFADGPTIIAAMESGSIDLGYIGPGAHKLAINGRCKIFSFSQMGNADALLALKSKGIETAADLKGKKVGYSAGTSSEMILKYTLEDAGLAWEDIVPFEMDASSLVTATISGALDACACWSPSTTTIKNELGDDIIELSNNMTFADRAASVASWIVMDKYYQANTELVAKFTKALYAGMDYALANTAGNAKWVAEQCAVEVSTVEAQLGDGNWLTSEQLVAIAKDGTMAGYYKTQQDGFIASGAVEKEVPVEEYVIFDNMIKAGE